MSPENIHKIIIELSDRGISPRAPHYFEELEKALDFNKVSRLEVISEEGRQLVKYNVNNVRISMQDDNRTMKIFYENKPT